MPSVKSRAAYHRQWREDLRKRKGFQEKRRFQEGFEAFRKLAQGTFKGIGLADMNGYTAAEIVKNLKLVEP